MSAILKYAINMLPYMLIAAPVYLTARVVFINRKKRAVNWYREIALFVFVLFLVGLASQTVIPKIEFGGNGFHIVKNGVHNTNLVPFKVFTETYRSVFVNGYINYFLINFLGNIVMFIPFGIFPPLLWKTSIPKTLLIGFSSSLFIEVSQLFLTRGTDVDDLMLNTAGTLVGILIFNSCESIGTPLRKNSIEHP